MEGYDYIFENYKIAETDFVPNTIEDFHDTKKVKSLLLRGDLSTKLMTCRYSGNITESSRS